MKCAIAQKSADRYRKMKIASRLVASGYGNNHGKMLVFRMLNKGGAGGLTNDNLA